MVTVRQRAAEPAQTDDVGVPRRRAKYERVAAADSEGDAVSRWQSVEQ